MANQTRYEVVTPGEPDALAKALQTEIDLNNTTFVIDHRVVEEPDSPLENQDLPRGNHVQGPSVPHTEVGGDSDAIMKSELASAHETIGNLNGEVARLRAKNLSLENQASSGKFYFYII